MPALEVTPLGYALGARVTGIDAYDPSDAALAQLRAAILEHLVVVIPGQRPDKDALTAFASRFGPLEIIRAENASEAPSVQLLSNKPQNGAPYDPTYRDGQRWHTDESYTTRPTSFAFISCKELPEAGGDTMFASGYRAYETLSPRMRALIDPLDAVHNLPPRRRNQPGHYPAAQPLVRVHPETGRKALYAGARAQQITGMSQDESRPLLDFLNAHATAYEFTYRHRWTVDDLLIWDNRCTHHIALADYDLQHDIRHMTRTAVAGEPSGYRYDPERNVPVEEPAGV